MNKRLLSLVLVPALCLVASQVGGCSDDDVNCPLPTTTSNGGTGGTGAQGPGPGGGGQGGGGVENTGTDTCPGDPYTISAGTVLALHGDTTGATDDYQSICGNNPPGSSGPDNVYSFEFTESGTLQIQLAATGGLNPAMYLRRAECATDAPVIWCKDFFASSRTDLRHVDAGTYFLIVDGSDSTAGEYDLNVSFEAPECGDGAPNPGEVCDDGNTANGDGCLGDCSAWEAGAHDDCSNPELITLGVETIIRSAFTSGGHANDHTFIEAGCGVSPFADDGGPDRVYEITTTAPGTLTLRLGYEVDGVTPQCVTSPADPLECWDRALHVRTGAPGCDGGEDISNIDPDLWVHPTNQVGCDMYGVDPAYTQEVVINNVLAGEIYWVFVDGFYVDGFGNYHLWINLE